MKDAQYNKTESYYYDNRWKSLFFLCVGLLVISLDNTILNVALPQIATSLEATAKDLQWIVDAYILVFAALLLTTGSIGDRIGRKRILQFGLIWIASWSAVAGQATSPTMLSVIRGMMGLGSAMIMPSTLSIITATFRDPKERTQAIALWAGTFGLGVGIGPVIGGWLIEHFDWTAVFFVNIPVAIVALAGGYGFVQDSRDDTSPKADWIGVVLSIIGLFALVYAIIEAGIKGWADPHVVQAFIAASVFLGAFAAWEYYNPHAMLPLQFFKNMSFTGANTALALAVFSMMGSLFFMSQYFQSVQGYSALETGIRVLPMSLVVGISSAASAKLSERLGIKLSVSLGLFLAGIGLYVIANTAGIHTAYSTIFVGMALLGTGMGFAMPPATDSIMGSVPVNKAGVGSAMNDTTRELGGALGIAILGTIMNSAYLDKVQAIKENALFQGALATVSEEQGKQMVDAIEGSIQGAQAIAGIILEQAPAPMKDMAQQISEMIITTSSEAFIVGMADAMFLGAAIMIGASLVTLVLLPSRIRPPEGQDVPSSGHGGPVPTVEPAPLTGD